MSKILKKLKLFFSNFYNWYLTVLGALVSLAFLAPITLALGLTPVAKVLYFIYSFFCHQFATRSFYLFDYQFAWCARDTGIWLSMFLVAVLIKFKKIKGIKWYWVIPFVIPIALDGGIQTLATLLNINASGVLIGELGYISNNLTRFMTGSVFGIGISLWISQILISTDGDQEIKIESDKSINQKTKVGIIQKIIHLNFVKILFLIVLMFPIFLVVIGIWDLTSERNNPVAPIESVPKINREQFFLRREDGICPVDASGDFLALNCFWGL